MAVLQNLDSADPSTETREQTEAKQSIESKQHLHAHVQMILTNLPFPPLPVVACDNSVASSHDMLHSAIACTLLSNQHTPHIASQKLAILARVQEAVAEAFVTYLHTEAPDVSPIYKIYTEAVREYLALYPGIDTRLCFYPYESVAASDTIVTQAQRHLTAYSRGVEGGIGIPAVSNSYTDILLAYAKTAWTIQHGKA